MSEKAPNSPERTAVAVSAISAISPDRIKEIDVQKKAERMAREFAELKDGAAYVEGVLKERKTGTGNVMDLAMCLEKKKDLVMDFIKKSGIDLNLDSGAIDRSMIHVEGDSVVIELSKLDSGNQSTFEIVVKKDGYETFSYSEKREGNYDAATVVHYDSRKGGEPSVYRFRAGINGEQVPEEDKASYNAYDRARHGGRGQFPVQ